MLTGYQGESKRRFVLLDPFGAQIERSGWHFRGRDRQGSLDRV